MKIINTKWGKIVKTEEITRYITWRKPEHYMIKHQGFGISVEELRKLYYEGVTQIIIRYKKRNGNIDLYKTNLMAFLLSERKHTFQEGDKQHFVPIKDMTLGGTIEHE